jgi:ParB family chromosome partitioning protein
MGAPTAHINRENEIMAKDSKEAYGAEGKFAGVWMDPDNVEIVGVDVPEDVCPQLADPDRIKDAPSPTLVESVYRHGVKTAITIRKNGTHVLAVDGRQRILAARLANDRLRSEGADESALIRIPALPDRSEGLKGAAATLVIANEHRKEDGPVAKARKAQRLREMGHAEEEIQAMFGVSKMTLSNWRNLLQVDPKLLAKVEKGTIPVAVGYQLGKLPEEEQADALAKLLEESGGDASALKGEKGRKAAAKAAKGESATVSAKLPAKGVKDLYARLEPTEEEPAEDDHQVLAHALLAVLLGDDPTGKGLRDFPSVHKVVRRVIRDTRATAAE